MDGGDDAMILAINSVLSDTDADIDNNGMSLEEVQNIVTALEHLNTASLDNDDLYILGIPAPDANGYSSSELTYLNNRISENHAADGDGDGVYTNDLVELENLVNSVDGQNINLGDANVNTFTYVENDLYDGLEGNDVLNVEAGLNVDLTEVHNIETIVLNSNDGGDNTTLGVSEISMEDIIDITDGSNTLTINHGDVGDDSDEIVNIDLNNAVKTDGAGADEGYDIYTYDNGGTSVIIKIEDTILVD